MHVIQNPPTVVGGRQACVTGVVALFLVTSSNFDQHAIRRKASAVIEQSTAPIEVELSPGDDEVLVGKIRRVSRLDPYK